MESGRTMSRKDRLLSLMLTESEIINIALLKECKHFSANESYKHLTPTGVGTRYDEAPLLGVGARRKAQLACLNAPLKQTPREGCNVYCRKSPRERRTPVGVRCWDPRRTNADLQPLTTC